MKNSIMLVDDSRAVFEMLKRLLVGSEYEIVAHCMSGEEALSRYGDVFPDLVIMDIVMPGASGLETSREIKTQWPDARILIVSALDDDSVRSEAMSIGCAGVYQKPLERNSILKAINEAITDTAIT